MRLRRLEPILRRALRGACAVPRGARVLVAVSGGADSTALLLALGRPARELGLALHAAHLHHGLRGAAADRDLEFVRRLCARLGVPLTAARWNLRLRMRRRGLSGEAGLRTIRREFLLGAARRARAPVVATAHTADDQLETVLLRLLRGTGLAGLGAMSARDGVWIKPLLGATRADVEADLRRAGERWCEDASNRDLSYARNRVRHIAIPALVRSLGPALDPARARPALARRVAGTAREARDAERALRRWTRAVLPEAGRIQHGEIALDSERVRSYPVALQRALLREVWKRIAPAGAGLTSRHLRALVALIAGSRGGARIALPGRLRAERERGCVVLRPHATAVPGGVPLSVPGRARWGGRTVSGGWTSGARALDCLGQRPGSEEFFAAEELEGRLELRAARADERFVPFGRRRPTRIGAFLGKHGIPREQRRRAGVLADAAGILWVIGVRRSARAPITSATGRALRVQSERHD